jgi:hypothetical protein
MYGRLYLLNMQALHQLAIPAASSLYLPFIRALFNDISSPNHAEKDVKILYI